jgi:hypothetical protein
LHDSRPDRLLPPFSLVHLVVVAVLAVPSAYAEIHQRGVVHTVFLWLKQPGHEQHRQRLLSATDQLRSIPGVREIRFGEMIESDRDIVDDSFDIGIYFYFDDVGVMNAYLVHPLHKAVVEQEIQPLVQRIVVHDFYDTVVVK